jgi:hypothetical protein
MISMPSRGVTTILDRASTVITLCGNIPLEHMQRQASVLPMHIKSIGMLAVLMKSAALRIKLENASIMLQ